MLAAAAEEEPTFTLAAPRRGDGPAPARRPGHRGAVARPERAAAGDTEHDLAADLVVACDGRSSRVRDSTGLPAARLPRADGRVVVPAAARGGRRPGGRAGARHRGPLRGHARPRRLLPDRLPHPARRGRRVPAAADPDPARRPARSCTPGSATASTAWRPGTTSSCCASPWTGCAAGRPPGCSASATPRTRCRRWAAWGSTSPCRTPWPPRGCSRRCSRPRPPTRRRSTAPRPGCSAGAGGRPRRPRPASASPTAASSPPCSARATRRPAASGCPCRCACCSACPALQVIPAYLVGVGVLPEHAPSWARRDGQPASAKNSSALPSGSMKDSAQP